MDIKQKKTLLISAGVLAVGFVVYMIAKPKKPSLDLRNPVKDKTFNNQPPPNNQDLGLTPQVTISHETVNWYPSWLPPINISLPQTNS
jgi:hypothetical protein